MHDVPGMKLCIEVKLPASALAFIHRQSQVALKSLGTRRRFDRPDSAHVLAIFLRNRHAQEAIIDCSKA